MGGGEGPSIVEVDHPEEIRPQDVDSISVDICASIIDGKVNDDQRLKCIGAPDLDIVGASCDSDPIGIDNGSTKVNSQASFCEDLGEGVIQDFNIEKAGTCPSCCLGEDERKCDSPSIIVTKERDPRLEGSGI